MMKFSKTNWLIVFLIVFIILTGFFAFQWWQVRGDLRKKIGENENLMKQVNELQAEIDKLKKEIEELKVPEGEITEEGKEVTDETVEWKTYRNEKRGFEIKYPGDWKIYVGDPLRSINFTKETPLEKIAFGLGINIYFDEPIPFSGCVLKGEEIIAESNKVYPIIKSHFKDESLDIVVKTKEECGQYILGDFHTVILDICFDKNLKYLGGYCEEGSGNYYYQFSLHCEGEKWQGIEGMNKCSQLFNQIISTFKFIK